MLALSNPKTFSDANAIRPGGPRVYTIAVDTHSSHCLGVVFLAPHQGMSAQRTAGCRVVFYVVAGKMLVNMRLDGCGGVMECFAVNKGGSWEVPCDSTYRMVNGLAMLAQLVFWQQDVPVNGGEGGHRSGAVDHAGAAAA